MSLNNKIFLSFEKLKIYCEKEGYMGYDPYDGLNSKVFNKLGFLSRIKIIKLVWIQIFKRSPINFRNLFGILPEYNPKALGLFLSSYCLTYKRDPSQNNLDKINFFIDKIISCKSEGYSGACWGYNFDWQSRAFFQPKNTPTIVVSSFIANSLIDAYEIKKDDKLLKIAKSTCDFILNDLNRYSENDKNQAFPYSPLDKSIVFNASLLGVRLLSRVYSLTRERSLIIEAKKAVNYVCNNQNIDGSWSYGTYSFHQWIDNFHTGYNLECIADYMKYSGDRDYEYNLEKGFQYYINTFFTKKGIAKYYSNKIYPIDIHSIAQLIITLDKLNKMNKYKPLVNKVLSWSIDNMQEKKGFFYYQKKRFFTIRIPYMRWSQAWMLLSLNTYLKYYLPEYTKLQNENMVRSF
jgi:hypothetical protein